MNSSNKKLVKERKKGSETKGGVPTDPVCAGPNNPSVNTDVGENREYANRGEGIRRDLGGGFFRSR